jgi:CRISPR-associated protein Csd1
MRGGVAMSWMAKLYETYENALKLDLPDIKELVPIGHILQNAHVNIVIDGDGNFKRAEVLAKRTKIILPATEESAGRTSGEAPHPLADKLQYVAEDYEKYVNPKNSYFESYKEQLQRWCESSFSHPKAIAVYHYISKGNVLEDLVQSKIVHIDDNNKLLAKWGQNEKEKPLIFTVAPKQADILVCWTVEIPGI